MGQPVGVRVPPFARRQFVPDHSQSRLGKLKLRMPTAARRRLREHLVCCRDVNRSSASSPGRAPARLRTVTGFYAIVAGVGFFWHAVAEDTNDVWRLDPAQDAWSLATTPLLGVLLGVAVVQLFRLLQTRMAWIPALHAELQAMLGRPSWPELVTVAAVSATAEEILFRGAMLDAWGPVTSSLVFALVHIPPRFSLWPWTFSSLLLGLTFASLTLLTGNLGPAVLAHFVINLQNLAYITRKAPVVALRGPIRPS